MKTSIPVIAILTILSPLAFAENDQKPHNAAGMWQSPEKDGYMNLKPDGTIDGYGPNMVARGKWNEDPETKKIRIKLKMYGGKLDEHLEATLGAEDKLSFLVAGKPSAFTRLSNEVDPKKILGTWKGTYEDDIAKGVTSHWIETITQDGKEVVKMISISKTNKNYTLDSYELNWRAESGCLIETSDAGTDDENSEIYHIQLITPEKMTLLPASDSKNPSILIRVKESKLPEPPEGYKKVDVEKFWEPFEELYDDEPEERVTEVLGEDDE